LRSLARAAAEAFAALSSTSLDSSFALSSSLLFFSSSSASLRSRAFLSSQNFTFLSYYAGATDRFTFQQAVSTTVAFMPLAFMYVAVGGAILKFRLVARGEADDQQYLPAIWTCFSVSAVGFLLMTLFVVLTFRKQKKKMGEGAELSKPTIKKNDSAWSDDGTGPQGAAVSMEDIDPEVGAPPPPALGTELSEATVEAGWREVVADDGDVYFFNDETGESQWDKPSTKPGEDFAE